ncbi:urease accessory protein UreF [Saccharopolyspora sp. CA-218241]|uniref:urease accessory protein UreF n=1 Tax=Saccharopolyspora sp. CA-218241 TaxID=3240027 RepID=UPI003D95484D
MSTGSPGSPGLFALVLLADGRFPTGGHAHSGGFEAAAAAGRVHDVPTLEAFLRGRAATAGCTSAAFTAATCAALARGTADECDGLDAELDARTPAPALRAASRALGRQLLRAARAVRPDAALDALAAAWPHGPHQPIALGASARVFGLGPRTAAVAALHEAVTGPATAAVRLLGLDPFAVHAALARLGPLLEELADAAAGSARTPPRDLPALSAPMLDISAEDHATWEVRLFAS